MPELSDVIRVTDYIAPKGSPRKDFGVTLFLTQDTSFLGAAGAGRLKSYTRFADVADDFESDTEPYLAAQRYFQQSPLPKNLIIAKWPKTAFATTITSGEDIAALNALRAITDAEFRFAGTNFTAMDLSAGANSYANVMSIIQTKVRAAAGKFAAVTFAQTGSQVTVTDSSYGDFSELFSAVPSGSGTDISGLLKLRATDGVIYQQGADAETISNAMDEILNINQDFYFVTVESAINDSADLDALSDWVNAGAYFLMAEFNAAAVKTTNENASIAAQISAGQPSRTAGVWSGHVDYKAVSAAARLSGVNLKAAASLITMNLKSLPGCVTDELTTTEINELKRKNLNYYTDFGATKAFADGRSFRPGVWMDVRYWLDWFVNAVQVDVFNVLVASGRVPQTTQGVATITEAIEDVCREGVRNGGIAPGTVSTALKGEIATVLDDPEFDGVLSTGYLIYSIPLSEQSQTAREAREAPAFRVFLKGSGAIHSADIEITFEN